MTTVNTADRLLPVVRTGERIDYDGRRHTITAVSSEGGRLLVVLRGDDGTVTTALHSEVTGHADRVDDDGNTVEAPPIGDTDLDTVAALVPDAEYRRMLDVRDHIREYTTGYRSGDPGTALPHEPRPQYDPAKVPSILEREKAKSEELCAEPFFWKMSQANLQKLRYAYRDEGLWGLRNEKKVGNLDPLRKADARVIDAIRTVGREYLDGKKTNVHYGVIRARVQVLLDSQGEGVKVPGRETFRKYVDHLFPNGRIRKDTKGKQTDAARPKGAHTLTSASRPGEVVQFDSTTLDVLALDDHGNEGRPELTIAVDVYTRSILGWRVVPSGTNRVDVSGIVQQMLNPEPVRKNGWEDRLRDKYRSLPYKWMATVDERIEAARERPVIWPSAVVTDHGNVYFNSATLAGMERCAVSVQPTRVMSPTDKAIVEATFGSIRQMFSSYLDGYVGSKVADRGSDVKAVWTLHEVEELFAEWVVCVWQRRAHDGICLFDFRGMPTSPNAMFADAFGSVGWMPFRPNPNLYLELLPTEERTVTSKGVQIAYLFYDDPVNDVLAEFRDADRKHGARLRFSIDVNDVSRIFFKHPKTGEWHTLTMKGADGRLRPFSRGMRDHTIRNVKAIQAATATAEETDALVRELLLMQQPATKPAKKAGKAKRPKDRGVAARSDTRQPIVERDRAGIQTVTDTTTTAGDGDGDGEVLDITDEALRRRPRRADTKTIDRRLA